MDFFNDNYYVQMDNLEIKSEQTKQYNNFLTVGLLNDEDNFKITLTDDLTSAFLTEDKTDSYVQP